MNGSFLHKTINLRVDTRENKWLLIILSFTIPFIIIFLSLIAMRITPFGDHNLAISDAQYYINGEMFFSRLLKGQENILYSMNNGLGGNEWSQFAWGSFSFGNLLALFATIESIPTVFTWICTLNMAICGVTMYLLIAYMNGHKSSNLIFSTSYALIGFNVVNCYQIGFVLGPETLPIMVLGLVLLFRGKNPILYIISLAFCAFFNFYFAFHLCVFSVVVCIGYLYVHDETLYGRKKQLFLRWFLSSLIAGFLAAPMWLPALKAYSGGGRLNQTGITDYSFNENMPFIQMLSKLFSGANSKNELVAGMPNIFCGILVVALVILYFTNKKISKKYKRVSGTIIGFYLLTFYINTLTIIMHGGTVTNWFPFRYSYVFSFILICLAVEEFRFIADLEINDIKRCGVFMLISALIVFGTSYEFITGGMVVLDFALLLLMYLGFWLYKTKPDKAPLQTLTKFLLILVSINLYANFIVSTINVRDWELDLNKYTSNMMVSGAIVDALNSTEGKNGFFRMEKDESESESVGADSYLYNYNGVSHSGPSERGFIHRGLCKIGINWFDMRHWYSGGVPAATDSLLGLKYIVSRSNLEEEKGYDNRITLAGMTIYQNPNALSTAIISNAQVKDVVLGNNEFSNLNNIWKAMTGCSKNIFKEQEDVTYSLVNDYSNQSITSKELKELYSNKTDNQSGNESAFEQSSSNDEDALQDGLGAKSNDETKQVQSYIKYTFTAEIDGPIYLYDTSIPESDKGLVTPISRFIGVYKKGDTVEGKFPLTENNASGELMRGYCSNLVFAYEDDALLADYASTLNDRGMSFNADHENDLKGHFTAESNQRILFTIPWDEGWACYIDGCEVPIDKTWDLFMSIDVPKGTHTWELHFFPAWMNYGIIISVIAFLALIVLLLLWSKQNKSNTIVVKCIENSDVFSADGCDHEVIPDSHLPQGDNTTCIIDYDNTSSDKKDEPGNE